jgi:hypothetical protein
MPKVAPKLAVVVAATIIAARTSHCGSDAR